MEVQDQSCCQGFRCLHGLQRGTELSQPEREDSDDPVAGNSLPRFNWSTHWPFCGYLRLPLSFDMWCIMINYDEIHLFRANSRVVYYCEKLFNTEQIQNDKQFFDLR